MMIEQIKPLGVQPTTGLSGLGDVTIGSTTLTTTQLLLIALAAYLLLKR